MAGDEDIRGAVNIAVSYYDRYMSETDDQDFAKRKAYEAGDSWIRERTGGELTLEDALLIRMGKITALLEVEEDGSD